MPIWVNNDGLVIKTGRDEVGQGLLGPDGRGGITTSSVGGRQTIEYVVDFNDFAASFYTLGTVRILSDTFAIPAGWKIDSSEFFVETAFAGASGTLDIGTVRQDRTTEIDFDGIDSAIAVAALTAGARIAGDGAQIAGANLANPGLLMVRNNTTRFTAGRGLLRVNIYNPTG